MTHAFVPLLKHATATGRPARIIFMSSELALVAIQNTAAYALSKRALEAYADSIRFEFVMTREI